MYSEMIIFLEDLKSLLLDIELDEEENEILIEVIDLIDDKILDLESWLLHYIITITLGIVATFLGVVTFYALRRINTYENIILNISNTVESIKLQLKVIDDKGTFESDDEVGFFFEEVKQLGKDLDNLFETEVEENEKETKEK